MAAPRSSHGARPRSSGEAPTFSTAWWRENLESLAWAVVLALTIRTFIIAPFKIPSGSMHPTLLEGDRILVSKFTYRLHPPRRGDIVVFYYPNEWHPLSERISGMLDAHRSLLERFTSLFNTGRPFIKRLIGVGGDQVEIRNGHVFVNGQPLDDRPIFQTNLYVNQGPYGQEHQVIHVPADAYFVLGDNSRSSHDSRFWGFVPKRLLIGRVMCIFWPLPRWQILR